LHLLLPAEGKGREGPQRCPCRTNDEATTGHTHTWIAGATSTTPRTQDRLRQRQTGQTEQLDRKWRRDLCAAKERCLCFRLSFDAGP
jgi:hypothetical protein